MVIAVPISAATACAIGTTFSPSSRTIVALISNPISRPKVGSTVTAAVITAPHTVIELPPHLEGAGSCVVVILLSLSVPLRSFVWQPSIFARSLAIFRERWTPLNQPRPKRQKCGRERYRLRRIAAYLERIF